MLYIEGFLKKVHTQIAAITTTLRYPLRYKAITTLPPKRFRKATPGSVERISTCISPYTGTFCPHASLPSHLGYMQPLLCPGMIAMPTTASSSTASTYNTTKRMGWPNFLFFLYVFFFFFQTQLSYIM